jgi:GT2 family glycosyltransferase
MSESTQNTCPDLSVVIVNWNTRDLLRACLASVPQGLSPAHMAELWVVDNASHDGSAAMVASEFPNVHLIANEQNVGFARANNQALEQSAGRHALLLNSDTEVLPGALSAMMEFLDTHPDAGAIGSRLLNTDGSTQRSCWNFYPSLSTVASDAFYLWRLPLIKKWVQKHEQALADPKEPVRVRWSAALFWKRSGFSMMGTLCTWKKRSGAAG